MKGLILKDLMNMKKQSVILLIFIGFYGVFAITSDNYAMFLYIMVLYSLMIPITTLSFDDKAKWDRYALSMPISRKDIVLGKYYLGFLCAGFGFIIFILFSILTGKQFDREMLIMCGAVLGASLIIESITLPLFFKFGVEKGRIIMLAVFLLPTVLIFVIESMSIPKPSEKVLHKIELFFVNIQKLMPYLAIVIVLLAITISISVSLHIYKKKEL